mgnify:CR=1 FL=1
MVKLNKIYTKIGDKGSTQLGDGKMVNKDSLRVDAYGSVDEANATIGLSILRTNIKIKKILKIIQNDLFDLGADLCIPDKKNTQKLKITKDRVDYIEEKIDNFNKELSSLNSFILLIFPLFLLIQLNNPFFNPAIQLFYSINTTSILLLSLVLPQS